MCNLSYCIQSFSVTADERNLSGLLGLYTQNAICDWSPSYFCFEKSFIKSDSVLQRVCHNSCDVRSVALCKAEHQRYRKPSKLKIASLESGESESHQRTSGKVQCESDVI